ncbi:hypothetical protein C5O32_06995 [Campylobacter jejuni]|nr:hypothetical protein [Campylobacter jejuni]EAJ4309489.1 hypothetical protein [Campylobacter jejuni]EAM0367501.1 hypothetical protein [Campylobacter jejuni]ECK2561398.1 hypothetical protein [Campylobacter jejuni]ECR0771469.1 hypothetical protein [Campylobacter jejuni]
MNNLEGNANFILVISSAVLAFFYQFLAYFKIETAQVIVLVIVFSFSGVVCMIKTLILGKNFRNFLITDILSKTLVFFVPFILAIMAKQINVFYYLVDYSFSFLTIGEFLAFLISIQSIRKKEDIKEMDFYNIFIEKFKNIVNKYLKLEGDKND